MTDEMAQQISDTASELGEAILAAAAAAEQFHKSRSLLGDANARKFDAQQAFDEACHCAVVAKGEHP